MSCPKPTPLADVTEEQLRMAWRHMRRPPGWPATLEEALQHPVRATCIRGIAATLHRPAFAAAHARTVHSLPAAPVPPTPNAPPARNFKPPRPAGTYDRKKAAANDRDDED